MKTTIELSDDLFAAAKRRAEQQGITLRRLVEKALASQLAKPIRRRGKKLELMMFDSQPLAASLEWEALRDEIYAEREDKAFHGRG
ncbi:MAG TPA: hypothetical protein VFB32_17580 [Rudaea sp.]|nr:hypothetical protein [Rudaea sp.]